MDKELERLLERARGHKMTAAEYRAQTLSFVLSGLSNPPDEDTLREQLHLPSRLEEAALAALRKGCGVRYGVLSGHPCLTTIDRAGRLSTISFPVSPAYGTGAPAASWGDTVEESLPDGTPAGDAPGDAGATQTGDGSEDG